MNRLVGNSIASVFKPHLVVMLVIFAGAAASGLFLLPGDAERVAMLERDGDNIRALELLEKRFTSGDRSQRTLYQLEQLYQHFGKLDKAKLALESLAERRPRDLALQRRLVQFYRDTQDRDAYLAGLSRLTSHRHSEPACRELIAQLRLIGQYAREREAIERCRMKGYRRGSDIIRLAELEQANGNKGRALALLRNVDDVKGLQGQRERLLLTGLLIDVGAANEIAERGTQWIKREHDEGFADALFAYLSQRNAHDIAIRIASRAGSPGDTISLRVAELMLDRDQTSAARTYLRGWIETADIHEQSLATRFITTALAAEDPEVALLAARRFGMQNLSEPSLVQIAEAVGATGLREEFESVRTALSSDAIGANPLLSAMIQLNSGSITATKDILDSYKADKLDTWRLALWARLMRETGNGTAADAKLRDLGVQQQASLDVRAEAGSPRFVDATPRGYQSFRKRATRLSTIKRRKARIKIAHTAKRVRNSTRINSSKLKARKSKSQNYLARPMPVARPVALGKGT